MPFGGPVDRRHFFAGGTGAILCTLAGHKIAANGPEPDWAALAAEIPDPPSLRRGAPRQLLPVAQPAPGGQRREYWIQAEPVRWNIIPTKRDEMMDAPKKQKAKFTAWCYRQYTANFAAPMGPAQMPGPLIEAETGDTLVVNFRNKLPVPVTMHPHGVFYSPQNDGAYKGKFSDPGGFVKPGKTFQYSWDAHEDSVGVWPYHDHGPMDPTPLYKGLFGAINIRKKGAPRPDVEHYIFYHSLIPVATGLNANFMCINGRSYAGNTPTLTAKVGQRVAQHVIGMSNDFHTHHVHGHRWKDGDRFIDNVTVGPADSYTAEWVEDNPGRWFYHCHVFSHLHAGMTGWYIVS